MTYLFDTIYFSISLSTHTLTKLYKSAFAFKLKHRISVSLSQEKIQKSVADLFFFWLNFDFIRKKWDNWYWWLIRARQCVHIGMIFTWVMWYRLSNILGTWDFETSISLLICWIESRFYFPGKVNRRIIYKKFTDNLQSGAFAECLNPLNKFT